MLPPTIPTVSEPWRNLLSNLATFVAPGLVLLLLAIQVAFGLRGFDKPDDSLLYILQVPGVLLGWGGVAMLVPLLAWMVLDWWGYDLNGFALKGLGSAVLGIAVGTLVGLDGGVAAGGLVGGGLAAVLLDSVGAAVAWILLLLMTVPACILAFSLQRGVRAPTPKAAQPSGGTAPAATAPTGASKPGLLKRLVGVLLRKPAIGDEDAAWYPQQRFDAAGNELPMDFGRSRDVGGIRFADEEDEAEERATANTDTDTDTDTERPPSAADLLEGEERLPTIPELLAGNFHGASSGVDRGDPSGGALELGESAVEDDGPIHVDGDGRPVAPTRPVMPPTPEPVQPAAEDTTPRFRDPDQPREMQAPLPFLTPPKTAKPPEPKLPPGVRYADEAPAEAATTEAGATAPEADPLVARKQPPPATPDPEDQLSQAVRDAVRGPAPAASDTVSQRNAQTIRKSLRDSVAALQTDGTSERHLKKLEAMGLFDTLEEAPADEPAAKAPPKPRKTPDAEAGSATATRAPAKKQAKPRKKAKAKAKRKVAARPKTTAKKKTARKKAAVRKKAARRASPKTPDAPDTPQARTRTPARKRTAQTAVAERKLMLEGLRIERLDPLFRRSVEAAFDRGAASPMLLTRRLGLPFARAEALIDRMVTTGVLRPATDAGSHPLAITRKEWERL